MSGSYFWLHPKNGGFSVYREVIDYEEEKRQGFSMYEDCRDLQEIDATQEAKTGDVFKCHCGKEFTRRVALAGHQRGCKCTT